MDEVDIPEMHKGWGRRCRAARDALDLSQRSLANICGITDMTISRIERGESVPSDRLKFRLAGALGKSVDDLFPWPPFRPHYPSDESKELAS